MKGIGATCGAFIQSTHHFPDTTDKKTTAASADEVKKRHWSPFSEEAMKETADEVEYNFSPFHHFTIFEDNISATVFHHFTM